MPCGGYRHAYKRPKRRSSPRADREFVAEHLRLAQQALSEITGDFTSEDLLGEIFSTFCVGK